MMDERNEDKVDRLRAENKRLRDKLRRVRDWICFAAASEGGIVDEIDECLECKQREGG